MRWVFALLACVIATHAAWTQEPMWVGAAKVDITPKKGEPHYRGVSEGTHDPLFARALVFRQGETVAGIVVCDLINVRYDLTTSARKLASEETGIPFAHLVVSATHTHTGPKHHNDINKPGGNTYALRVRDAIVAALQTAQKRARPAELLVGKALQKPPVSFNRRFYMKNGMVRMNPGLRNPNILRPEGPIDPEICMLLIRDARTRKPFAALSNFALHLDTVGGKLYSADYPYYIHQFFASKYGNDFVSVFATGTCGDINHFDVTRPGPQRGHVEGYQTTRYIGGMLADTIRRNLPGLKPVSPALAVRRRVLRLPLQTYTPEQIAWAKNPKAKPLDNRRPFLQRFMRYKLLQLAELRERFGDTMPIEVQVIRLGGDTALVFLPGEIFVELGMSIKNASPFENTFVVELANTNPAYVPTRRAFANGDYEAVNSRLQPGSGERMVQAAVAMLLELAPQEAR